MNRLYLPNFNLDITLLGGQSFGWDFDPSTSLYTGFTRERIAKIMRDSKDSDYIFWQTYPVKDDFAWLSKYLRLDMDYEGILKAINRDEHIDKAIQHYKGLRLLQQDFFEATISYLCSPTKTIVGIRQCIRMMRDKFGDEIEVDGEKLKLFPNIDRLADADLSEILECKVGFRGQNIKLAAEKLSQTDISLRIHEMSATEAVNELKTFRGIGDKVADCISVYSLAHDELTPFDVWGMRVLSKYYGVDPKSKYEDMRAWVKDYWGDNSSWAGQFLFEYIRLVDSKNTA